MRNCRRCERAFEPSECQIKKADYLCRSCRQSYDAAWREKRRSDGLPSSGSDTWDKDKRKAWAERYYANPENRKRRAEAMKQYRTDPKQRFKHMARWALNHALESGKVNKLPCSICGEQRSQGHHADYNKPLVVVWLCAKCHRAEHAKAEGR